MTKKSLICEDQAFQIDFTDTYFFFDFVNHFSKSVTAKLETAPTIAKSTVLAMSSERMLGIMLNKVPDAVPIFKETLLPTGLFV